MTLLGSLFRCAILSGTVLLAGGLTSLAAQETPGASNRAERMRTHPARVAAALRLADELELSNQQRAELNHLRLEILEGQVRTATARIELRSEIQAGLREPEAMRAQAQDGREARRESRTALQERFNAIITEDQRAQLRNMARNGRRGDAGIRRQRGRERTMRAQGRRGQRSRDARPRRQGGRRTGPGSR